MMPFVASQGLCIMRPVTNACLKTRLTTSLVFLTVGLLCAFSIRLRTSNKSRGVISEIGFEPIQGNI